MSTSLARACTRAGVIAVCGALFGGAAPALAAIGNFDGGDGNQACVTGGPLDWACSSGPVLRADDSVGNTDDVFGGGSKEDEPGTWTYATGSEQDKSNLATVWRSTYEPVAGESFLNLALKRASDGGTSYFAFELNQKKTTWTNGLGTVIPCRTDGDVLVSYDVVSATPVLRLYKWDGSGGTSDCPDGAIGTWGPAGLGAPSEAALNAGPITNVLGGYPAGTVFAKETFGEASIDLAGVADELNFAKRCEFFAGLQAHSRASDQTTATLKDRVAPVGISVVACDPDPGPDPDPDPDPLTAPTIAGGSPCLMSRTVTLSGTADPDSQVIVRDGVVSVGLADADGSGAWMLTLTDVTDGVHDYSAVNGGDTDLASSGVPVLVDASPDVAPVITSPADGSSMVQGPLVIGGTAEPGSTVAVSDGATFLGTTVASGTGAWQYTIDGPALGTHDLAATATDTCNASASTARSSVTVTDSTGGTGDGGAGGGGGGGGTGGDTPTGSTPTTTTGDLAPVAGASGLGSLPLVSVPLGGMPTACAGKVFTTFVTDKKNLLSRVVFRVDGKVVATVKKRDKQRRFLVKINPRKYKAGERKLTATLVPKSKRTKQTTVTRRFRRCDACKSRRGFNIRLVRPNGEKLRTATVFVNNRKVRTIRGKRLSAPVRLVGLPKGTYKVRIRAVTVSGRVSTSTRTYRTCVKKVARKLATKKKS